MSGTAVEGDGSKAWRWLNPVRAFQLDLLRIEIKWLQVQIDGLPVAAARKQDADDAKRKAAGDARKHFGLAIEGYRAGKVGAGWKAVHDAKECLVLWMLEAELKAEAHRVLADADNLDARTAREVRDILKPKEKNLAKQAQNVRAALNLRNKHWDDHYAVTEIAIIRAARLVLLLFIAAAFVAVLGIFGAYDLSDEDVRQTPSLMAVSALIGFVGGCLTTITSLYGESRTLPKQARRGVWYLARPFVGLGAALIVVPAAMSGFLGGIEVRTTHAVMGVAGAAGMSEVLLATVMEKFAPAKKQETKDTE